MSIKTTVRTMSSHPHVAMDQLLSEILAPTFRLYCPASACSVGSDCVSQGQEQPVRTVKPKIDIIEAPSHYIVRADLPGCPRDRLQVHFDEDALLVIRAERPEADLRLGEDERWHFDVHERSAGVYERHIRLGKDASPDAVEAKLLDGVLEVRVPRVVPVKRTIAID